MIDLGAGAVVGLAGAAVALAWATSASRRHQRIERIEQAGASVLLGRGVQRVAYRALEPLGAGLARAGLTANAVTLASIPFAALAAVALAEGHYGVGALLGAVSYGCDALDGMIARATDTASDAGEVLDATCDRVCEALMLGGLAVAWRASLPLLALVMVAQLGAQQVTLASAKAEVFPAARDHVPRGLMRRAERAVYFVGSAALAGVLLDALPAASAAEMARVPLIVAMALIGVVGNTSALSRLRRLARTLRSSEAYRAGE